MDKPLMTNDEEEAQAAKDCIDEIISKQVLEGCTSGVGESCGYRFSWTLHIELWKD